MPAYRDSKAHPLSVGMRKVCKSNLRVGGHSCKVSALLAVAEGLNGDSPRPPHPGPTVREIRTACIDPAPVREGVNVSWRLAQTTWRDPCDRHAAVDVAQVRKGVTGPSHAEPIDSNPRTLFTKAFLEVRGLCRRPNCRRFAW